MYREEVSFQRINIETALLREIRVFHSGLFQFSETFSETKYVLTCSSVVTQTCASWNFFLSRMYIFEERIFRNFVVNWHSMLTKFLYIYKI